MTGTAMIRPRHAAMWPFSDTTGAPPIRRAHVRNPRSRARGPHALAGGTSFGRRCLTLAPEGAMVARDQGAGRHRSGRRDGRDGDGPVPRRVTIESRVRADDRTLTG